MKTKLAELPRIAENAYGAVPVTVAGIVTSLQVGMTRRGKMVRLGLDDASAGVEIAIFSELYDSARSLLKEDELLVVHGKVAKDDYSGGWRIQPERVLDLTARAPGARARAAAADERRLRRRAAARAARAVRARAASAVPNGGVFSAEIRRRHPDRAARLPDRDPLPQRLGALRGAAGRRLARAARGDAARAAARLAVARRRRAALWLTARRTASTRAGRDRELLRRLYGYVRPHWKVLAHGRRRMIATAATEPALPRPLQGAARRRLRRAGRRLAALGAAAGGDPAVRRARASRPSR